MWSDYDKHADGQQLVQAEFSNVIVEAAELVQFDKGQDEVFRVVCIGCSTGGNDCDTLLKHVFPKLWQRFGQELKVEVVFMDVPENSWEVLFETAHGKFAGLQDRVFVSAVAGSFVDQVLRENSVHFVLCFSCLHWLDKVPDGIPATATSYVALKAPEHKDIVRKYSDEMFLKFLEARNKELKSGGVICVGMDGETPDIWHQFAGPTVATGEAIIQLIQQGEIPPYLENDYFLKTCSQSCDRIRALVKQVPSFQIKELVHTNLPCPYYLDFTNNHKDLAKFGQDIGVCMKACLFSILDRLLIAKEPSETERHAIIDKIFNQVAVVAATDPKKYSTEGISIKVLLTK